MGSGKSNGAVPEQRSNHSSDTNAGLQETWCSDMKGRETCFDFSRPSGSSQLFTFGTVGVDTFWEAWLYIGSLFLVCCNANVLRGYSWLPNLVGDRLASPAALLAVDGFAIALYDGLGGRREGGREVEVAGIVVVGVGSSGAYK
ncbi:hypothetical protein L208DRAFT_1383252 [Tricholoma matsutake]|nr:hypothetical protein L208DRAFT_1383252 [Tricholoma matsutake 945]